MKKLLVVFLFGFLLINLALAPLYAFSFDEAVIEGFCLNKFSKGKVVYSIEADKASLGSRRIGFFDIGFIKVANLENVSLALYQEGNLIKKQHFDKALYELNTSRLFDDKGNLIFSERQLSGK
ncbi:MAG: hypothetical protein WC628_07510 [Candidatus Omnitrophota bacterium]